MESFELIRRLTRSAGFQLGLVVLVIALIWGSIFLHLEQEHDQDERGAWQRGANLASGFGESINRTFESVDQVMLMVRALYKADPGHFDIATLAPSKEVLSDFTLQISLTDARGIMIGSNLGQAAGVDLSDREHVRVHFTDPGDNLFISVPVFGRVSGKWSIQFTRKVFGPDGKMAGILVVSLNPQYLASFYDSIDIGRGAIVLTGLDGIIRAQAPSAEGAMGKKLPDAVMAKLRGADKSGRFQAIDSIDGEERLFSYRRLAKYPLAVMVGLSTADVFEQYQRDRTTYLLVGSFLTLLVTLIAALLIRQGSRLRHSQQSLSATLANIGQGILMVGADGTVAVINRRAAELLELPDRLARRGARFRDILDWQLANGEFVPEGTGGPDIGQLAQRGGIGPDMYERTRRNGVTLEVRTQTLEQGGAVRTYTDISERRRNEQTLAAARDAAEAATRAQSDFLAMMSHEIRTPMNGISGMAGLLIDSELSPQQRRFATTLREAADSLMQVINDILDFSKLEAQHMELETISFDTALLVSSVVDLLQVRATQKRLWLRSVMAPELPQRLYGDPGRLRQILLNLVGNALKFTNQGGVTIEVSGSEGDTGSFMLRVQVRDSGIGVAREAQPHLFDRFYQVDGSSSRGYGGTGLGLAICQRLVGRMGGSITVASEPGAGAVFAFEVPLSIDRRDVKQIAQAEAELPERLIGRSSRRLRILLAEDNGTNRLVATTRLEMMGHRVDAVASGGEAVEMVQTAPYDLVLMDVMMPQTDGLQAARAIRALPGPVRDVPIVAMTASVFPRHREACREAGMDDFLGKPFTPEELRAVIDRVMSTGPQNGHDALDIEVDHAAHARIMAMMGDELAADLVSGFVVEARVQLAQIEQLAGKRDWRALGHEAQRLHEAAGSIGFVRLAALAGQIASEPDSEAGHASRGRLEAVLDETAAALRERSATAQGAPAGS